ncbi:hypothetical protein OAP18_01755, partial [Gammaproteobacteria bacterium]|nr:hypothetical protein [Gammaproteobacteria bacterium]
MSLKKINYEWHVDIRPGGRHKRRWRVKFATKKEATDFIHEKEAREAQTPSYGRKKKEQRTLIDLADAWYELHGNTLKDGKLRYSKMQFICRQLDDGPASKFTKMDYLDFRKERLKIVGRNSVNHDLT